jgi:hypothetical protein
MAKNKHPAAEVENVAASWLRLQAAAGTTAISHDWEERARLEAEPYVDGRSRRATGRNKQLNVKVKREFDRELRTLAKARKVGLGEMLEIILAEWKANGAKQEPHNA